jgi:hypothetical protein
MNDEMTANIRMLSRAHDSPSFSNSHSQDDIFEEDYLELDEANSPEKEAPPRARATVNRTVSSIQNRASKFRAQRGISQDGIDENDAEEKTEESLRAMTHLTNTTSQEYSCNSMSRLRRAHFSEMNGYQVGGSVEPEQRYVANQTTVEKKRRAQDVLLSQQLRQGIIPEQLLRKIPRMGELISLDLSHYGMGDSLCICLGRR